MSECLGIIQTVLDKNQAVLFSVRTSSGFGLVFDNQEVEKTNYKDNCGKKKRKSHLGNVEYLLKREDKSLVEECVWEGAKPSSNQSPVADDQREANVVVKADFQTKLGREIENEDHKKLAREVKKCFDRGICRFSNWGSWEVSEDGKSVIRFYVIITAKRGFGTRFILDKSNWPVGMENLKVKDV
eukprot:GFUD01096312.1.p1 GENE.GFUD01096312.1~~GFUD01096312.1.p1  ORF type:complete len:200 (-),score=75.72 GFUD01096312.1:33-587(-)